MSTETLSASWRVSLEAFAGPLDLLLYLVKKEEVDIHDIPIKRILDQYLLSLKAIDALDLDSAGEFLVMAATLMVIKSRMLLPTEDVDLAEEIDPRYELVQQLLDYKKYKDSADLLQDRHLEFSQMVGRPPSARPEAIPLGERPLAEVSVFDLLSAFAKVLESLGPNHGQRVRRVSTDDYPVRDYVKKLRTRLSDDGSLLFSELLGGQATRQQVIGNFLAILLLLKLEIIVCAQDGVRGDIRIIYRGEAPDMAEVEEAAAEFE